MKKKTLILTIIAIVILLLLAVFSGVIYFTGDEEETLPPLPEREELCGDNSCGDVEYEVGNCPEDCADVEQGVLDLGFMIHIEGWKEAPENEDQFHMWAAITREMADVLEEHGAVGTFEFSPEFVEAAENWDDDIILELYERGHGIGVHADLGFQATKKGYTQEEFVAGMVEQKTNLERVFGHEVRHVSGICSELDWAEAAIEAGFEFTTGGVAMCLFSLPTEKRPAEFLTDKDILDEFHSVYPYEIEDMVYPWRVSTARDWLVHDPEGELVMITSDGVINGMTELRDGVFGEVKNVFDEEDIEMYMGGLDEYLEYSRDDRVNSYYVALSIGDKKDMDMFHSWLEGIEPYVEEGKVEWKSLPDVYDEYVAWEATI